LSPTGIRAVLVERKSTIVSVKRIVLFSCILAQQNIQAVMIKGYARARPHTHRKYCGKLLKKLLFFNKIVCENRLQTINNQSITAMKVQFNTFNNSNTSHHAGGYVFVYRFF